MIFDPQFKPEPPDTTGRQPYSVSGTTIRTELKSDTPELPPAADAESLLYGAWGEPGNAQIARWIATWLAGQTNGTDFGMAAAQVEQRLGHKKVASLLADPGGEISSPKDQSSLGTRVDQRTRGIWRHGRSEKTLRDENVPRQCGGRDARAEHDSHRTRPKVAIVDVFVSRGNAGDAA